MRPSPDPPLSSKRAPSYYETVLIDEHQQQEHSGFCIDSGSVYLFHEEKENELKNVCLKKNIWMKEVPTSNFCISPFYKKKHLVAIVEYIN